jgi:hypothetical protein
VIVADNVFSVELCIHSVDSICRYSIADLRVHRHAVIEYLHKFWNRGTALVARHGWLPTNRKRISCIRSTRLELAVSVSDTGKLCRTQPFQKTVSGTIERLLRYQNYLGAAERTLSTLLISESVR